MVRFFILGGSSVDDIKGHIERLTTENKDIKRRLGTLEDNDKRHEEDIRHLYENQAGTKAYVTQILNKIDSLETKLFSLITQLTANQEKDRKAERTERSKTAQIWLDFSKYIVGVTIAVVIIYIFTGGTK